MGYRPSSFFAEIIEKTQDEFLEGKITSLSQAKDFVKNTFPL